MPYSQLVTAIIVNDPTNPTELTTWQTANPLAVISSINIIGQVYTIFYSLSSQVGVLKTNSLITTAVTADQVILTYTVTTGKTLYLTYAMADGLPTVPLTSSIAILGTVSLEIPSGTKVLSKRGVGGSSLDPSIFTLPFNPPIPIASGTIIRIVCTPAAVTSTTWIANFGGYEV